MVSIQEMQADPKEQMVQVPISALLLAYEAMKGVTIRGDAAVAWAKAMEAIHSAIDPYLQMVNQELQSK